ncbi:MAG: putative bifunctional diguanylate cyclase/phosphodiesterase [Candidatus Limnocylindrales bacterium]
MRGRTVAAPGYTHLLGVTSHEDAVPLDATIDEPELPEALQATAADLGLMRLRLRLALIAMFAAPLAITLPVVYGVVAGPREGLLSQLGLVSILALGLGGLAVWLTRRVMDPVERMELARAELATAYTVARTESLRDALTGLGNHRAFQEEMAASWAVANRHGTPLAVVLIDLDEFKLVNDAHGHAEGDEVLRRFASSTAGVLRRSDRAYRIGGDEFALLLPHTDADAAGIAVRRLLSTTLEGPVGHRDWRPISFSAGISSSAAHAVERDHMVREADAALYWGKRHGRTCVTIHDPQRHGGVPGKRSLPDLSAAVGRVAQVGGVRAVFQPIYDLGSGKPVGFEALVRPLPGTGFSDPGALFEAAEATGRTVELDIACISTVLAAFATLNLPGSVTLNVSPRTLESPDFNAAVLLRMLARHRIDPACVVLELTEREAVEDLARLRAAVDDCRAAGVRVAADDVGAGNAGLRLLSQLRFDIIKIDLSLVQGGTVLATSQEIVRTLKDLTDRWGATVIAEGIETSEQLAFVRSLGIRAGQGYLLGRPEERPSVETVSIDALLRSSGDWLADRLRAVPAIA